MTSTIPALHGIMQLRFIVFYVTPSLALVRHSKSLTVLVSTFTRLTDVNPLETILAGYAHHTRHARHICPPV